MREAGGEPLASDPAPPAATPAPASTTAPSSSSVPVDLVPALTPTVKAPVPPPASSAPSPERPERLDWGDIEDEDDDDDEDVACNEGTESAISGHAGDGVTQLCPPLAGHSAPFNAGADLGGGLFSPLGNLCSAAGQSEAPAKLKSILVVPSSPQSPASHHQSRPDRRGTPPVRRDLSPPWEEAKSKRLRHKKSFPSSSSTSMRTPQRQPAGDGLRHTQPRYKEAFRGKCFRCLASDHRLAQCRDPPRCLSCRCSGHFARRCPRQLKRSIQSRLTFPSSSIHTRLTFPASAPDIHNRLIFPPLPSSPKTAPANQPAQMAYTSGAPLQRPVEGFAVLSVEGAMAAELRRLRCTGVVLTAMDRNSSPAPVEVQRALNQQLRIPLHNIATSRHKPEDFFTRFDHPDQAEQAVRKGTVMVGGTSFLIQPWRDNAYSRPANWYFHCKIIIERLPLHAWCEDGVRQVLGDLCAFDYIEPVSFTQENTERLECWVWMWNPDQLPCSKLTTIFPEGAGRSRPGVTAAPPVGDMVDLIIHLDRYFDWSPPPASRTPSSRASGLPSSSSSDSDGRPFPFYQKFEWIPGILDGRTPRGGIPRIINAGCRGMLPVRRDQDPDEEDRRGPHRSWTEHIAARGRPADDAPLRGGGVADRYRSRSPAQHGRRRGMEDHTLETRGRSVSRLPPSPSRARDPACRDDEGWDRRRSRSPMRSRYSVRPEEDGLPFSTRDQVAGIEHERYGRGGTPVVGATTATAAPPPQRFHPDPIVDFLAGLCQDAGRREVFFSDPAQDPMLLEVASVMQHQLSYSPSSSPPPSERYPASPSYVPISELWTSAAAKEIAGEHGGGPSCAVMADGVAHMEGSQHDGLGQIGLDMGCDGPRCLETLVDQVHSMDIDGPSAHDVQAPGEGVAPQEAARERFFGSIFAPVPPPVLPAPAPAVELVTPTPKPIAQRQSKRLMARPSSVPVSRRATHRLIRELGFVGQNEPIGDEAVAEYERMHYGPMPRKTVAALAAVSRVASGVVMAASAALAADAVTAQVEAV
ncbi:unnamed protein product [Urochloa humidicola]